MNFFGAAELVLDASCDCLWCAGQKMSCAKVVQKTAFKLWFS